MPYKTMSPSGRLALTDPDDYIHHFPDGNASVARAFVRAHDPGGAARHGMEDLVLQPVDYSKLDDAGQRRSRLRLNASVVRVKHDGPPESAQSVTLTYVEDGKLKTVAGRPCRARLLAPRHPAHHRRTRRSADRGAERPGQDPADLHQRADPQLGGLRQAQDRRLQDAPKCFWDSVEIDFPVSVGSYKFADKPSDPVLLHLSKLPLSGDAACRRATRPRPGAIRWSTSPSRTWSAKSATCSAARLQDGGFDPARDIEAITCNRWSHGYALEYMRPWDAFWPDGPLPIDDVAQGLGPDRHRQFGRRRLCLCAFGDRPGRTRGQGTARRQGEPAGVRRFSRAAARPDRALTGSFAGSGAAA